MSLIGRLNKIISKDSNIAQNMVEFKIEQRLGQGIGTHIEVRAKSLIANFSINKFIQNNTNYR